MLFLRSSNMRSWYINCMSFITVDRLVWNNSFLGYDLCNNSIKSNMAAGIQIIILVLYHICCYINFMRAVVYNRLQWDDLRVMTGLRQISWFFLLRLAFCYKSRHNSEVTCNAKEGNPFGPFWNTFNIDFDESAFYGPLHYDTHDEVNAENWAKKLVC